MFNRWEWVEKVGPGRRRLADLPAYVFACPLCRSKFDRVLMGGDCSIVRTTPRSVTVKCFRCRLHFSMTWHRLAQAARKAYEHQLNEEEIREVSVGVGLWQSMEVEALNDVFRSPSTKQTLAELPPEIDKGEDDSA